jgi:hypothetical protein
MLGVTWPFPGNQKLLTCVFLFFSEKAMPRACFKANKPEELEGLKTVRNFITALMGL